jgi:uncharacterized protein (DUF433 family)
MSAEQTKSRVVTSSPDILSGTPVFAGTCVPVLTLIDYLEAGDSIDDFLASFPTVTRDQAIAFFEEAKERSSPPRPEQVRNEHSSG